MNISVIVPVYNVEQYVEKCITSVLSQLTDEMELILVNDGSTDDSGKICIKYAEQDNRIRYIEKKNEGLSAARNVGIEHAKGEYIYFLDSDDWIREDALGLLYECAVKNSADIVVGEHVRVINESQLENSKGSNTYIIDKKDVMRKLLLSGNKAEEKYVTSWNKLFRRELWKNLQFPIECYYEDEYMIHRLYEQSEIIVFMECVTYYYRTRPGSITTDEVFFEKKYEDFVGFSRDRMDFYKSNYQSLYLDSVRFYIENVTIAYLLYGKKCEERTRFRKDACERVWNVYRIVFIYMNLKYKIKYLFFIISPELYQKIFWIKVTKGK